MQSSGEPARLDLERNECEACGTEENEVPWLMGQVAELKRQLEASERRAERAEQALQLWEKFRWYATGESGHSPLTMPLWYALVFEEAAKQGKEALGLAAALGGEA